MTETPGNNTPLKKMHPCLIETWVNSVFLRTKMRVYRAIPKLIGRVNIFGYRLPSFIWHA